MFDFAKKTKDMTAVEILNYYRNLYYAEPQVTERGIVANAINDYFKEVAPRAEVAREIFEEIERIGVPRKIIYQGEVVFDVTAEYDKLKEKYTGE